MIFLSLMLFLTAVAFEETDADSDAEWVEIPTFCAEPFFFYISSFAVFIS